MIGRFAMLAAILGGLIAPAIAAQVAPSEETAAAPSAEETVRSFLALNKAGQLDSADGRRLFGGELARMRTSSLGPLAAPDKTQSISPSEVVVRLPAGRQVQSDIYLYLSQSSAGAWTIDAIRALAMPAFVATLRNDLMQRATRTPDEERTLGQINLLMLPDAGLRTWFGEHRDQLNALRALAEAEMARDPTARTLEIPAATAGLAALHASSLAISLEGAIVVAMGGVSDNEIGFLFAPRPAAVPPIDRIQHIWIEGMGGGWFLFKTT